MIELPDKTCVLVVGIEEYALGPAWDLPGAFAGAKAFIKWLRQQQVPPNNIYFYASPKERADASERPESVAIRGPSYIQSNSR